MRKLNTSLAIREIRPVVIVGDTVPPEPRLQDPKICPRCGRKVSTFKHRGEISEGRTEQRYSPHKTTQDTLCFGSSAIVR